MTGLLPSEKTRSVKDLWAASMSELLFSLCTVTQWRRWYEAVQRDLLTVPGGRSSGCSLGLLAILTEGGAGGGARVGVKQWRKITF